MIYQRKEIFNMQIWAIFFLDFLEFFCHHESVIQKVEKWRIQELEQVLNRLALLLRTGKNSDWANVFSHFAQEAKILTLHNRFNLDSLKRLVPNIVNCFESISSLRTLVLIQQSAQQMETLNHEFRESIRNLFEILVSIEEKWTDPVN